MTLLRLLNPQGIAGIAASLCLALLLLVQKAETHHWRNQSGQFEQLYQRGQTALAETVADYRAAAARAADDDRANADRVRAQQASINEGSTHDLETRLAAARAAAERLRIEAPGSAADPRDRASAPVPGLPAAPGSLAQAAGEDRLPAPDALTATEQAIQLDELIKWVRRQSALDPNQHDGPAPLVDAP